MSKLSARDIVAQIVKEEQGNSSPPDSTSVVVQESIDRNEDEHVHDFNHEKLWDEIEKYLEKIIDIRKKFAFRLYWLVVAEVVFTFFLVFLYGFGLIYTPEWMFALIVTGIVAETLGIIYLVVSHFFPKKDSIEFLKEVAEVVRK